MREYKFIIVKDRQGQLRHFKGEVDHYLLAKHNHYDITQVIEEGYFIDKQIVIQNCINQEHKEKVLKLDLFKALVFKDCSKFFELLTQRRLERIREIESKYIYEKNLTGLREGD
jgi:hypothetical protein